MAEPTLSVTNEPMADLHVVSDIRFSAHSRLDDNHKLKNRGGLFYSLSVRLALRMFPLTVDWSQSRSAAHSVWLIPTIST